MPTDLDRMRESYDRFPEREWERLTGGAQARLEFAVTMHAIDRHLPSAASGHIRALDAGGGPGRYTIALARRRYHMTLLDLSPKLLETARKHIAQADSAARSCVDAVVEASITDLGSFGDGEFDAVLCLGGPLSHLIDAGDRHRAIAELRRVVKPTGPVLISVMNRLGAYRSAVQWPDWFGGVFPPLVDGCVTLVGPGRAPTHFFYPEEFCANLGRGGLEVRHLYGCNGIGAHLDEENLLALMEDEERWAAWSDVFLETCNHPSVIGVSNHILAVTQASGSSASSTLSD